MGRNKETMKRVLKFISPYKAKIIIMLLTALDHRWIYPVYTHSDW